MSIIDQLIAEMKADPEAALRLWDALDIPDEDRIRGLADEQIDQADIAHTARTEAEGVIRDHESSYHDDEDRV